MCRLKLDLHIQEVRPYPSIYQPLSPPGAAPQSSPPGIAAQSVVPQSSAAAVSTGFSMAPARAASSASAFSSASRARSSSGSRQKKESTMTSHGSVRGRTPRKYWTSLESSQYINAMDSLPLLLHGIAQSTYVNGASVSQSAMTGIAA